MHGERREGEREERERERALGTFSSSSSSFFAPFAFFSLPTRLVPPFLYNMRAFRTRARTP